MEEDKGETGYAFPASGAHADENDYYRHSRVPMIVSTGGDPSAPPAALRLSIVPRSAAFCECPAAGGVWLWRCGTCFMHEGEALQCSMRISVLDFRVARVCASGLDGGDARDCRVGCPSCAAALERDCSATSLEDGENEKCEEEAKE